MSNEVQHVSTLAPPSTELRETLSPDSCALQTLNRFKPEVLCQAYTPEGHAPKALNPRHTP